MNILRSPSPNSGPRVGCNGPDMVVLHYTAMDTVETALTRLCNPTSEVSAHYLIGEDGQVYQLVAEDRRAWHAGAARWGAVRDVNCHSIGVELANPATPEQFPPFPEAQMLALEALLGGILKRWKIPPARVLAHSDVAPGRKFDPGPEFDWRRLAKKRLAVWPETTVEAGAAAQRAAFEAAALRVGYRPRNDGNWCEVLEAFRLRFRTGSPGASLGSADLAAVQALARAHPCIDPAILTS